MAVVNILLVEDDEIDVMAVKRAFRELKIANPLYEARDGVEALELLGSVHGKTVPRAYIIQLDLNVAGYVLKHSQGHSFLDDADRRRQRDGRRRTRPASARAG